MRLSDIRHVENAVERLNSKVEKSGDCLEWTGGKIDGYGCLRVTLDATGESKVILAHRLAYMIHHGEVNDSLLVCHSCDNPPCINPFHLFEGTVQDNTVDMFQKGRGVDNSGEDNGRAIRSADQVLDIVRRCRAGEKQTEVARIYGVKQGYISNIMNGLRWSSITGIERKK